MSKYVYINGMRVVMEGIELESYSVLQHCELIGIQLPRFCYHDQLSIAGNCRMCMVELSTSAKPVIACSTEITAGMQIYTDSAMIRYARENVLEFLLINHPLDCPICDQGGECDLQDFSLMHGSDRGRFSEDKRTVLDTSFGALIKGIMTRCIHCTRCVRYFAEIVGSASVGTVGRGSDTEIMYMADMPYTNIAGNVIDIRPVGALTSRPYSFACRPWELLSVESIDILDGLCSNITIDCRGAEIMRILPRANSILNIDWITDKIRFCYDGLKVQRIVSPMRRDLAGVLHICS
jgi:NADH dehydrogenase (ubiquinone) Fe-S protein 1